MKKKNLIKSGETGGKSALEKIQLYLKSVGVSSAQHRIGEPYRFQIRGTYVTVTFSKKADAPTLENALVKIATGRLG